LESHRNSVRRQNPDSAVGELPEPYFARKAIAAGHDIARARAGGARKPLRGDGQRHPRREPRASRPAVPLEHVLLQRGPAEHKLPGGAVLDIADRRCRINRPPAVREREKKTVRGNLVSGAQLRESTADAAAGRGHGLIPLPDPDAHDGRGGGAGDRLAVREHAPVARELPQNARVLALERRAHLRGRLPVRNLHRPRRRRRAVDDGHGARVEADVEEALGVLKDPLVDALERADLSAAAGEHGGREDAPARAQAAENVRQAADRLRLHGEPELAGARVQPQVNLRPADDAEPLLLGDPGRVEPDAVREEAAAREEPEVGALGESALEAAPEVADRGTAADGDLALARRGDVDGEPDRAFRKVGVRNRAVVADDEALPAERGNVRVGRKDNRVPRLVQRRRNAVSDSPPKTKRQLQVIENRCIVVRERRALPGNGDEIEVREEKLERADHQQSFFMSHFRDLSQSRICFTILPLFKLSSVGICGNSPQMIRIRGDHSRFVCENADHRRRTFCFRRDLRALDHLFERRRRFQRREKRRMKEMERSFVDCHQIAFASLESDVCPPNREFPPTQTN
jgi:hypothetical protein